MISIVVFVCRLAVVKMFGKNVGNVAMCNVVLCIVLFRKCLCVSVQCVIECSRLHYLVDIFCVEVVWGSVVAAV